MLFALLALLALLILLAFDCRLQVTQYHFKMAQLPGTVEDFRVVHLSDLHGATFGRNQEKLIEAIREQTPDLIVMTGDMVDRKDTSVAPMQALLQGIAGLAPIFAVHGNHELDNPALAARLEALYEEYGVTLLQDEMTEVRGNGVCFTIGGMRYEYATGESGQFKEKIPAASEGSFSILLYHATNQYEELAADELGYQYLFCGHTHGGIVRIPFVGGVIDNESNLFPQYDSGVFDQKTPTMVSSRGLGNSSGVPIPRVNNRPQMVCVVFEPL